MTRRAVSSTSAAASAQSPRGLPTDRALLFIIDGAKALRKAITDTFGTRALIQRCREHKQRNVAEALPERLRAQTRGA